MRGKKIGIIIIIIFLITKKKIEIKYIKYIKPHMMLKLMKK